jgi:hypothetical protein
MKATLTALHSAGHAEVSKNSRLLFAPLASRTSLTVKGMAIAKLVMIAARTPKARTAK